MLPRVFAFLYGSVPASFTSALSIEHAVASLRGATAKSAFHSLMRQAAAGRVTERKVSLQRVIPFVGNSFKPFFVGKFEVENGQTHLRGAFTMHWSVKLFMTVWFGFCLLWTAMATISAIAKPAEAWLFPLAGLGMLLSGFAFVALCKWFARNDQRFITEIIEKALSQDVV